MKTSYEMAVELHQAIGQGHPATPTQASDHVRGRRLTLILEEVAELVCALYGVRTEEHAPDLARLMLNMAHYIIGRADAASVAGPVNLAHIAKEAVDVHVVVSGTSAEYGIPEDAVYAAVHASNLAKAGGPHRADGKQLKPEGWQPPDVAGVLAACCPKCRGTGMIPDPDRGSGNGPYWDDPCDCGAAAPPAFDREARRDDWLHNHAGEPLPPELR